MAARAQPKQGRPRGSRAAALQGAAVKMTARLQPIQEGADGIKGRMLSNQLSACVTMSASLEHRIRDLLGRIRRDKDEAGPAGIGSLAIGYTNPPIEDELRGLANSQSMTAKLLDEIEGLI